MTFNVGHVAGGSHAGWKIQKPAPKPWTCSCFVLPEGATVNVAKTQPAHMSRCPDCKQTRP